MLFVLSQETSQEKTLNIIILRASREKCPARVDFCLSHGTSHDFENTNHNLFFHFYVCERQLNFTEKNSNCFKIYKMNSLAFKRFSLGCMHVELNTVFN